MIEKYPCPCCSYLTMPEPPPGTYGICPVCGWEDDPVQFEDHGSGGGESRQSLGSKGELPPYWRRGRGVEGPGSHATEQRGAIAFLPRIMRNARLSSGPTVLSTAEPFQVASATG